MAIPLLLVDDDAKLARLLRAYAEREGFELRWAERPSQARAMLAEARPALVLLDVMLPEQDGFSFCAALRDSGDRTPVIMLTARGAPADRVVGLNGGADDYVAKPFDPPELFARVNAVLRRTPPLPGPGLDADTLSLHIDGRSVTLTASEFRLLEALTARAGQTFTRERMLELLGDDAIDLFDRAIDQHVSRLRAKVELDPKQPKHLLTVRGVGYRFVW